MSARMVERLRAPNLGCALPLAAWALGVLEVLGASALADAGLAAMLGAALAAAALAAVPALVLALLTALLLRLVGGTRPVVALERFARGWLRGGQGPERHRVVGRHARVVSLVVALTLFAGSTHWLLARLWRLQAADVALGLAVAGTSALALAALALGALLARLLVFPLGAIDRRLPLPWPRDGLARAALVALPVVALGTRLLARHRALLAGLAFAFWLALLAAGSALLLLAFRRLAARAPRLESGARWAIVLGAVLTSAVVGLRGGPSPSINRAARASVGAALGVTMLRRASDFDRDGAAAWAGGADCAPFDPKRSPLRVEIAGNGIDEDCDGRDAQPSDAPVKPRESRFPPQSARRFHLLWLVPDGVRADRLGCYGQPRSLTPNLDALAAESLRFSSAYAQSSATVFSFASMFIGRNPEAIGWHRRGVWPEPDARHRTVAERLQGLGYRTAIFTSDWLLSVYPNLLRGYDTVVTPEPREEADWSQHTSPTVSAQVIEHIAALDPAAGPMFLTVHYNDPHFPYVRHPTVPRHGDRPIDLYDNEVAFTDRAIGALLDFLRFRQSLWRDTVVVVTADHGEEFGEHGGEHHARRCYRESTAVPLLVRVPGLEPAVIDEPVALIDVAPTLLELVGEPRAPEWQGQSLLFAPAPAGTPAPARPIFCAVASQHGSAEPFVERAVRRGSYLLVEELHAGRVELYDRLADPLERIDRSAEPALAPVRDELRALLRAARTGDFGDAVAAP